MKTENHYTETDLGNISLNPRGEYDPEAFYEYLDTVSFDGGSYMCLAELGTKITGIPPVPGTNTEHWQVLTLPGGLTPEYITMHDEVTEKAKQVEVSRAAVELSQSEIEAMQADVAQLHKDTQDSAQSALASKNQAAGYASAADTSRQAAERARQDVDAQIPNIDAKLQAALNEIDTTRQSANTAVKKQEELSVQAVKDQTGTYITEQKNLAKQELDEKVNDFGLNVDAIKKQVADEGSKQVETVQTAQTTAMKAVETAKSEAVQAVKTEGAAQTGNVSAEGEKQVQAVQTAAQEIIADREQIQKNKTDITTLKEDLKALDNVVTFEKSVELIQYKWTIVPINIKSGDAIIIKNPHGLYLPVRTLSDFSETSKVEEFNINSDKEYIFKAAKDAVGIAFYQETSPVENVEVIRYGMDKDVAELRTKVDIIANYNVEKHFNDFVNYEDAYVDTNGELASSLSWRTTDYIECASIVDRKIRIHCKQLPTVQYISFYNKYKCHIGGIVGTKNMYVTENLVIPVNAHYIRLSFLEDNAQYYSYDVSRQLESAIAIQKTSNPLYGKKIACTGDSITAATDSVPGNGYADLIAKGNGATVSNHAIWGAVLAQGKTNEDGTSKGCIYDTIAQMPADADVVLMSGGINDADYWNEPSYWGTMTGDYTSALDTKTFAGALEAMCKDALLKWAGKPIIYVIEHKMTNNFNSDYGKHFEEVEYPLIKKILEKWGISYVDLYKGMPSLSFVHDYKKRYSVDDKGVHPNVEGYLKFYVPRVESEIIRLLR